MEHRPINPSTTTLYRDGAVVVDPGFSGTQLDYTNGLITFRDPPEAETIWELIGTKWRYFSDEDLGIFISTALEQHVHNRGDDAGSDFTSGDIKPVEEYPIAILSVIQALWALATDAAFDIDIFAPDGVNIPRSERYRQLMGMIGARQGQYDELAQALNIGLHRVEVFTMRRTAKLTNRLVPVFLPQEYDDGSRPKRVHFPPMLQGTAPIKTGIANYDHEIISGDSYKVTLDFPYSLAGCEIANEIRRSIPQSRTGTVGPAVRSFEMNVIDAENGIIELSLSPEDTRTLPYSAYWEMQIKRPEDSAAKTAMRGMVKATNNEIVRSGGIVVPPA